jgi:large repetitive protein
VTVTDSAGGRTSSPVLAFRVYGDPTIGSVTVLPSPVDVGQPLTFTAAGVANGTGSYRYVWMGLPSGCVAVNASSVRCAPSAPGSGSATVVVVDTNGANASASGTFTVLSDPTFTSVGASGAAIDLGGSATFAAVGLSGGTGSYGFVWTGLPDGCVAVNASQLTCTPTATGTWTVRLTVTDSNGVSVNRSVSFAVDPALAVAAPSASPSTSSTGGAVTFSVTATGGSGTYTYAWSGLPPGCAAADAPTITCAPSATGSYSVTVVVTDTNGGAVTSATLAFTVNARPSAGFLGLPGSEGLELVLLAAIVAGAAIGGAIWAARRRRTA